MANLTATEIFKFMALRAPQKIEHEKDIVHFIRDRRIQDTYLPAETHDDKSDSDLFSKSQVGQYIYNQIKTFLKSGIHSNRDMLLGNQVIAENIKKQFYYINERTPEWVDEFVDVIRNQMADFNKAQLRDELDAIVKKHFTNLNGINDYVEKLADAKNKESKASQFCNDFDQLFDQLYVLYVCKRKYPMNLEYVLNGLRALHIIRFLNIESNRYQIDQQRLRGCLLAFLAWFRRLHSKTPGLSQNTTPRVTADDSRTHCAEMKLTDNGRFPIPSINIETKDDLARLFEATPCIHKMFAYLIGYYKPFNDIRPIGIGDLLVVKQFLQKYEAGEISHIENVLQGESKDRSFRTLNRTEETGTIEAETTEETQKELQTTSRYELQTETASTIQSDLSLQLNTSVSATYGMVSFSGSAGMSYSQSKNDSQRSASNFSKEIIDRSLSKIQKRVREERTTTKITETEEIDKHGFNNVQGNKNIAGIYRWLDKQYIAQVYNYGKRLMFEFVIPDPAAFIKEAMERNKPQKPKEPSKPVEPNVIVDQIGQQIVYDNAKQYDIDVSGLDPFPAMTIHISFVCNLDSANGVTHQFTKDIPVGYAVSHATVSGALMGNQNLVFKITIDGITTPFGITDPNSNQLDLGSEYDFPPIETLLEVGVFSASLNDYTFNVTTDAERLPATLRTWQNKAYGLIMNGYQKKLAEYKSDMENYQSQLDGYNADQQSSAQGFNPNINEDIIKLELKKHCLTMITKQFASDKYKDEDINFDAMRSESSGFDANGNPITICVPGIDPVTKAPTEIPAPIPAIDIEDARAKGTIIQFLEQAFEWPQICYILYPYFWGHRPDWWFEAQKYYNLSDPLFAKFLQAGAVRVLVAVHPAYETAVMHYLFTQEPWNGGEAPAINDPLYIPIYIELRNQQDDLNGAVPYGDPWKVIVPTSLVYLQDGSELPVFQTGIK